MEKQLIVNLLLETGLFIENQYIYKYADLITDNLNTEYIDKKTQQHHIIPQYCFEINGKQVDNSKSNLVNLLYKDHLIAHYYLACCSVRECIYKNLLAMRYVDSEFDFNSLDLYQKLYENSRVDIFEKTHTIDANKKISNTLKGVKHVLGKTWGEHKPRESRKNPNAKNKKLSEYASTRTGEKNSFYGKTHSEKTRRSISEKHIKKVKIGMFDLNTKELVREFDNLPEVVEYVINNNVSNSSMSAIKTRVREVCKLNTDFNRAYGYNWRYL